MSEMTQTVAPEEATPEAVTVSQSHSAKDITPRNIDFGFDETVHYNWLDGCPGKSNLLNAMSLLFPAGETFFIDSTRPFLKEVQDPKLKKEIKNFMTQEAIHTREHEAYNEMLERDGLPAKKIEAEVWRDLKMGRKVLNKYQQLGVTVALEHWTAVLANGLLSNPEALDGAHPQMRNVWLWHAVEESEHKAVCFDLMRVAIPDEEEFEKARKRALRMVSIPFMARTFIYYTRLMYASGNLFNFKAHWSTMKYAWGKPGIFRKMWPEFKDYFRAGFHPWDHDNREYIEKWDAEAKAIDQAPEAFLIAAE